jgi:hypothetical protein
MSDASTGSPTLSASQAAPAPPPQRFIAPKRPWWREINLRIVLFLAIFFLPVGAVFYVWARSVISGGIVSHGNYLEVDLKAMSTFDLDQINGRATDVPQRFRDLEGKRVALDGQMWAPRDAGDGTINYFQLVYSKTKCCFNGPPLAQHFVDSNVLPNRQVIYYGDEMVRVWGTLHVRFRREAGGVIKSVYAVDVDKVDPM